MAPIVKLVTLLHCASYTSEDQIPKINISLIMGNITRIQFRHGWIYLTTAGKAMSDQLSVFILLDCTNYEGCVPLHVFKHRDAAVCMKAMAEAHDQKKPTIQGNSDAEWDEYGENMREWSDDHPVKKGFQGADDYCIDEVPFHEQSGGLGDE